MTHSGWSKSAAAWLDNMSPGGDFTRKYLPDGPILDRILALENSAALDLRCDEGRFCRMMAPRVQRIVGLDQTKALLQHATSLGQAEYVLGRAEEAALAEVAQFRVDAF
ncbi:MAG: hypothetical protein AAF340_10995 [Pseudomonadota bacterium]